MSDLVYQKQCFRCKETKLFENFNKNRSTKDGYAQECRDCKKIIQQEYIERLLAQGKLPYSLQRVDTTCSECGIEANVFKKSIRKGYWRCQSCASTEIQSRPEVKVKASANAREQLLRQGGIQCDDSYKRKKGVENHSWKGGNPNCIDCGKKLSARTVERCVPCSKKLTSGENHHNWKGGKTPQNTKERNEPQAVQWRKDVMKRDKYHCQLCSQVGGKLTAHHIKRWSTHPELRFDIDNGITLCTDCHKNIVHQGNFHAEPLDFWTKD